MLKKQVENSGFALKLRTKAIRENRDVEFNLMLELKRTWSENPEACLDVLPLDLLALKPHKRVQSRNNGRSGEEEVFFTVTHMLTSPQHALALLPFSR